PGAGVWRRELRHRVGRVRGGSHRSPARVRLRRQEAGPIHDGCIRTARAAPRGSAHTIDPGSAFVTKLSAIVPLLLAVAGSLVYHASAKSIPRSLDPTAALLGLYGTALAGSAIAYALLRSGPATLELSRFWHPTVAMVGLGALMIELGFLLAYRAAWPVSVASVVTNAMVAVLLLP